MKTFMTVLLTLGVLVACDNSTTPNKPDEPDKPKEFVLDPGAIVLVNGKMSKTNTEELEYIVKNAAFISRGFIHDDGRTIEEEYGSSALGLQPDSYTINRDIENYKFKFFGNDVIRDGKPGLFFKWVDMTFTVAVHNGKRIHPLEVTMPFREITRDTVAYIPNSVARECKANMLKAFEAGDLEECYRIFKEDYTYTPITGAELRKLKADGLDDVFAQ